MKNIIVIFIIMFSFSLFGQNGVMHFTGNVKDLEGNKRLAGVKITAYKGGSVAKSVVTSGGGSYDFTVPLGDVYKIKFEKSGYVGKFLVVDTKNVVEEDLNRGEMPLNFEITLFAKVDDVDFSFLNNSAVAEYIYDPETGYMEFDQRKMKQVKSQIQDKIDEMIAKRAQDEMKVKNFNKLVSEGDKLYSKETYADALIKYEDAKKLIPDDPTILIKIADTKKKVEEQKQKDQLAAVEKQYQDAIKAGESAFNGQDYEAALQHYSKAAGLKPNESLPTNKIVEIEEILKKLSADKEAAEKLEKEYNNLITAGNNLFKSDDFENAKSKFEGALKLKPGESYPQEQITIINQKLKDLEANKANEENYQKLMDEGASLFGAKDYQTARSKYQEASNLKPTESLPKSKIAEIDEILAKLKDQEKLEEDYNKLISEGDAFFTQENWEGAKQKFEAALVLKAGEKYPTDKLAAIKIKIEEQKKEAANQEQYDNFISGADQLFEAKKYKEAKDKYNLALGVKPNAAYPLSQIGKIDELLKKEQDEAELHKKYELLLADAENLFNSKKYAESKAKYEEALNLKPTEEHPKTQIATINKLLKDIEAQKAIEENYKKIVAEADGLLGAKNLNEAKGKYQEALKVKPGEAYPNQKIQEIDQLLLDEAKNNKLEAQYQALVKEADALFDNENYNEAKSKYVDALAIKKDEKYPQQRIELIAQKLLGLEEAKKREEQYKKLIKMGDDMFVTGSFEDAKSKYTEALKIKPDEAHPKSRIDEINKKLAGQMAAAEKEAQYKKLVADGNALFGQKNYTEAKSKFQEALSIKQNEPYPTDKIAEINELLKGEAANKALLEKYKKIVEEADGLFQNEKYSEAILKYKEALSVKQNEDYPQQQITKIEGLMKNEENSKNDEQYNKILGVADKYFGEENYDKAIELYNRALTFKPQEEYPRKKLKEIEDIKAKLAEDLKNQGKIDQQYKDLIAKGDGAFNASKFEFAIEKYEAALNLKPSETYPQQKIDEINKLMAETANISEINKKFADLVIEADGYFGSAKYDEAIAKYEEALKLKANEQYPKDQIELAINRKAELHVGDDDAQYKGFIKMADEDFAARNWDAAYNSYMSALNVKPDEIYPQNRLKEIQQILDELAAADADQAVIDKKYNDAIEKADAYFNSGKYKEARTGYQFAQSIKNEAYPSNQIIICDKKLKDLNNQIDNAQIEKIIKVADKKLGEENYEKALSLYERVIGFRPNHEYAKSKIAQINELLAKLNADDVNLTDWGNEVNMDESNLQLLIAKSQADAKWQGDTTVSNQKHKQNMLDQYRSGNQYDANHDAKNDIAKVQLDLKKAEADADDHRVNNTNEVNQFKTDFDNKNNNDQNADNNFALKENRKIENFQEARVLEFEKSDDKRLNNELNVVAYNVELKNKGIEGDQLNYDGATKTRNQIGDFKLDVDDWKQEADLNREDNSKKVNTYNYDLDLDNKNRQQDQIDLNYDQKNEINSVELEIENNFKNADVPRADNSKKVVTYNNGLNEKIKADNENQYNQIDGTKNDIGEYKINTEKWKKDADDFREDNELDVIAYNTNLENEQRNMNDGFYDAITDNKNDIRDVQTLIKDNQKDDDKPRENNTLVVGTYKSDLDNDDLNNKEIENNKIEKTKIDVDVLVDTKNRKNQEGANISVKSANNVANYSDDLTARKNKNAENENDKIENTNGDIDGIKNAKLNDISGKAANKLSEKYPQGVTEEKFEKKNAKGVLIGYVTRRIVVQGDRGDVYEKIQTKYGTTYLKNSNPCTEYVYTDESGAAKLQK
jgi:tetratricopeptide (TPR) repeat protein